jgi:hypothetical protein
MISEAPHGKPLPPFAELDDQEWIPDLLPRPDGIRFARGMLLGIILCLPVWLLGWVAVTDRF